MRQVHVVLLGARLAALPVLAAFMVGNRHKIQTAYVPRVPVGIVDIPHAVAGKIRVVVYVAPVDVVATRAKVREQSAGSCQ